MSDFAIRQSDLSWGRVRNRRPVTTLPEKFPHVCAALKARQQAWNADDLMFRAARLAALMTMHAGKSAAHAVAAGYRVMAPRK